jgi:BRCT domain type II-containing protein
VIGSCWTSDTATIQEDDESQDPAQVNSPVHKATPSSNVTEPATNTSHPSSANNGVQEIADEMSTEL